MKRVERPKGDRKGPHLRLYMEKPKGDRKGPHPTQPNPRLYYDGEDGSPGPFLVEAGDAGRMGGDPCGRLSSSLVVEAGDPCGRLPASLSHTRPHQKPTITLKRLLLHLMALGLICAMIGLEFGVTRHAQAFDHTNPSVDVNCQQFTFSPDGNPFPLCPGPYPGGGNCVWWAWEQWHLLGYNLPLNWGNAADWIVDAERFGLPVGTQPRLGSIAVFPVADGVWAFGTAGHVAFVTWVSQDHSTFNVTYQNYGDPTPMFTGTGYNVSYINQPRFQDGQMRFIYFPGTIDASRFAHLPGIDGNTAAHFSQVAQANQQLTRDVTTGTASRIALGLAPGDDLLLLNRQTGQLQEYSFTFGNQYQVFDNRLQAFIHEGVVITARLQTVDSSSFSWQANLDASITTEELY